MGRPPASGNARAHDERVACTWKCPVCDTSQVSQRWAHVETSVAHLDAPAPGRAVAKERAAV
jgi:hypothetical protein